METARRCRGWFSLNPEVCGDGHCPAHVQWIAHKKRGLYAGQCHQLPGMLQVLPGVARVDVHQHGRQRDPMSEREQAPYFSFRRVAWFARTAGEYDPVNAPVPVERDRFVDALTVNRRWIASPCRGSENYGGVRKRMPHLIAEGDDLPCYYSQPRDQQQGHGYKQPECR